MNLRRILALLTLITAHWALVISAPAQQTMHVTYLWHMHQPVYYPYETPQQTDANGRFNFSVQGVWDGDRVGAYTTWPKDAVQMGADKGMAHAGAQMSYSGSLAENNNNLWGYSTGASWDDSIDWARNGLRTSLNNPRLDTVGIAYHHSLMPLTCKESMKMQIRLHKEQVKQLWDTTSYSKGFWPPECAFAEWMIPALVEEGLQWVIVDNGHLFRAVPDFPWSDASSCRVNPADMQNPTAAELGSTWVQLQNVWAPTKVLAPWSYQPHYTQFINPNDGSAQKIIAVPAGRYEGNENGRGGYGAFKPENVWGSHVGSVNPDANHPMLLLCHSDGDNYGMKNSDAWHGQHNNFLEMCKANASFDHTSVQDYLDMYPPNVNDVIHVEPGSWVGIDGGTPYFEKWLSSTYVNGENPDRFSWSVLVAAQNRVILADSLENSYLGENPNMDDVEWGINNDTARAWHAYLNGETSCYWYWDLDRANPWDGNVTRACNTAIYFANQVLARHPGVDAKGPSIFPPQRDLYNPGARMWNEATPASSDFEVWSYVDDVSGLSAVRVYWRTDKDGVNPISSVQNETFAGGSEVNGWNQEGTTSSWDAVKGPDSVVPNPVNRAMKYSGKILGQSNVLIDYFVEAVDTKGNTNRSDIFHVYVGQATNVVPVTFSPTTPDNCAGATLVSTYNSAGRSLSAASPVTLMISFGNTTSEYTMSGSAGGQWTYTNSIPGGTTSAKVMFRNGATYDDNSGNGWTKTIGGCYVAPAVSFNPIAPNGCDPVTITYSPGAGVLGTATQVLIHVGYNDWQGVPNPDPAMTKSGTNWVYVYSPPAGAYQINCVFNNGAGVWESNNGADYGVGVSNCSSEGAAVVFTPGTPTDCDGAQVAITYNPAGRALSNTSPVYVYQRFNGAGGSPIANPMAAISNAWIFTNTALSGISNIVVYFGNSGGSLLDDNGGTNWSVTVSACATGGPSAAAFSPESPSGCNPVVITYSPNFGPLRTVTQVMAHVGRNGWKDVAAVPMAKLGSQWVYTNALLDGTYQINCCFNDGGSTWDNNNGADWAVNVTGCTSAVPEGITFAEGSPAIPGGATNQNLVGEAFDFNQSGGSAGTLNQGGFGSFGQVYVNYDSNYFYVGASGADMVGDNNGMVLFLEVNTLGDNAHNVWSISGLPDGLDRLHNVWLEPGMDIAIVLGDEYGDGIYTNFNLADGYDFGQGVFYLSGSGSFVPVAGVSLSQYDGSGAAATTSSDDDANRLTDRWECRIPWGSLGATGIESITNCWIAGVIASSSTNGQDRYLSSNILGTANPTNANYGFSFMNLTGTQVRLAVPDSDGDGLPDAWERQHFPGLGTMGPGTDYDQDGQSDRDEYWAGTHPRDEASCFRATHVQQAATANGFVVRWFSASNKTYELYRSTNLMSGLFDVVNTSITGTPSENAYTDTAVNVGAVIYKVISK